MRRILSITIVIMSLNSLAVFSEKGDLVANASAETSSKKDYEFKIELGNLVVRQSAQIELNKRLSDKVVVGVHGGYYQAPTDFLSNQKQSLNKKDMYAYKKAENIAYKVGAHVTYLSNGHNNKGFLIGLFPTFVRGSYLATTHFGVLRTKSKNHLQLPIRAGFQWYAKNDLTISSDVEAGVHYTFKEGGVSGYHTFNIFNIGMAV